MDHLTNFLGLGVPIDTNTTLDYIRHIIDNGAKWATVLNVYYGARHYSDKIYLPPNKLKAL